MKKSIIAMTTLTLGASLFSSHAEDANKFKNTLNIGATLTSGNSDMIQANVSLITEGEKQGLGAVRAGLEANYGESKINNQRDTTVENARIFGQLKSPLSPKLVASLDLSAMHDNISLIDYRILLAPGIGIYAIKNDSTSFFIGVGPAYIWERIDDKSGEYFAARIAERIERIFGSSARLWQSLEYLPKTKDLDDFLLSAELGAEAAINSSVKLRAVLKNQYDSKPTADIKRNDLSLITGVSVSF